MKTLLVYYSYTGHTKKLAVETADRESADLAEIAQEKAPDKLTAYAAGCVDAVRGKAWPIKTPPIDWKEYDRAILMAPVWAGNAPPPFRAFLDTLPGGKAVSVTMVAASGKASCEDKLRTLIRQRGSTLTDFKVVKG
ncbi:MAG: hypothetical protein LBS11_01740 [Oscillospiraceae bacterium]|jgi:flavodoxin|nr:hypothetical protein [Oscillospiraceae bacterium]